MLDGVCERWKLAGKDISQKGINQIRNLALGEEKSQKSESVGRSSPVSKAEAIRSRKLEYRRMEAENAELVSPVSITHVDDIVVKAVGTESGVTGRGSKKNHIVQGEESTQSLLLDEQVSRKQGMRYRIFCLY